MEIICEELEPANRIKATTVLEVIPLLVDIFWVGMAVTIMADLTFGSILTMVVVPVLYATVYGVHPDDRQVLHVSDNSAVLESALR